MRAPPRLSTLQNAVLTVAAVVTIAVWIAGGWAFLDSFRNPPPPKPAPTVAEKSVPTVAEKSPPLVPETSAAVAARPSVAEQPAGSTTAAAQLTNNPPKPPPEPQPPPKSPSAVPSAPPPAAGASPQIAATDRALLADESAPAVADDEPVDPGVRELILQGWASYHRPYTPVRWQEARRDFERALEIDPQSSEARIGLASILSTKLADGWSPVLQEDMPRAERLLREAIDKGGAANRAAAHFALGVLRQMQNRMLEARDEFELAISLAPDNARAYLHLGETLLYLGQPQAAIPPLEQEIRLSPDDPNIAITYWALGTCQLLLGRVDQAIDLLQTARAANSRLWVPHFYLAGAYGLKGDFGRARAELAESLRLKPALRSVARMQADNPWLSNPQYWALQKPTLNLGLKRAGFPDQ